MGPKIKDRQGNERMEFFTGQPDGTGRINTLHIVRPKVSTRAGIRQGDSLAKVKQTYPKLELFRAKTDATGDVYVLRDDSRGLFFEMDRANGTVEHISAQGVSDFYPFQMQICGGP